MNPDHSPFCIGGPQDSVTLPIRINQTTPILIEILRVDLGTNSNETIVVSGRELGKLKKQADRELGKQDPTGPLILKMPIKGAGLYRLSRVIDQSKLEVRRELSDTLVVRCPSASIEAVPLDKCKGDLTDLKIRVQGTPPLRIRYSKTVNNKDTGHHVLEHLSPEDLVSLPAKQSTSGTLVSLDHSSDMDISWARTQSIHIPINESLGVSGGYKYSIDEVHDACGNVAVYTGSHLNMARKRKSEYNEVLEQVLNVHERPRAEFQGCSAQHELKVESGKSLELPIRFSSTGSRSPRDSLHQISYVFEPEVADQERKVEAIVYNVSLKPTDSLPRVHKPGLYSLKSVSTGFCTGEILEPSTCLLTNPPEPSLIISHEAIPGKCAGKPVGLAVGLELTGTPPFRVLYTVSHDGGRVTPETKEISQVHDQVDFRPSIAGRYVYTFTHISDAVYKSPRSVSEEGLKVEQEIKPPASARFVDIYTFRKVCIEEPATFEVEFLGDGLLELEYELIHNGRHKKLQKKKFKGDGGKIHTITTDMLQEGGDYTFALLSMTDGNGCKNPLNQEFKLDVGLQKPKVSFGFIANQRNVMALEGKKIKLPLRLQGSPPWYIYYRNLDHPSDSIGAILHDQNDEFEVKRAGLYEITDVHDAACPGTVDSSANQFGVQWIPRPAVHVSQSATIQLVDGIFVKKDVCEADEDATEIYFSGTPPFQLTYEQRFGAKQLVQATSYKSMNAGLNSAVLKMETSNAGLHEYELLKLGDYSYNHDPHTFTPLTVQQRVLPNPSARFTSPGKTYKYCKDEEAGDEVIPIALDGVPPFYLKIEIKHHTIAKPEIVNVPHVESTQYNFHIPHRVLALGTHAVTIRKVMDSHGCQRKMDFNAPHVQVNVADAPTISPLDANMDYCVGDRISYILSGVPPFNVFYTFQGQNRKAVSTTTSFRRLAEKPGEFTITGISDQRSTDACKAKEEITKIIHEMPSVRVSKGKTATAEIHEGSDTEILFEFGGTPPFEFM